MDFHGLQRKELQELCKKHGIPANLKNVEMADLLSSLLKKENKTTKRVKSCLKRLNDEEVLENREPKKVKFSPQNETFIFEKTDPREMRLRARKSNSFPKSQMEENPIVVEKVENFSTRSSRRKTIVPEILDVNFGSNEVDIVEEGPVRRISRRKSMLAKSDAVLDAEIIVEMNKPMTRSSRRNCVLDEKNRVLDAEIVDKVDEPVKRSLRRRSVGVKLNVIENDVSVDKLEKPTYCRNKGRVGDALKFNESEKVSGQDIVDKVDEPVRRSLRSSSVGLKSNVIENDESVDKLEKPAYPQKKGSVGDTLKVNESEKISGQAIVDKVNEPVKRSLRSRSVGLKSNVIENDESVDKMEKPAYPRKKGRVGDTLKVNESEKVSGQAIVDKADEPVKRSLRRRSVGVKSNAIENDKSVDKLEKPVHRRKKGCVGDTLKEIESEKVSDQAIVETNAQEIFAEVAVDIKKGKKGKKKVARKKQEFEGEHTYHVPDKENIEGGSTLVPSLSESREDQIDESSMEIAKCSSISSNKPFTPQPEDFHEEMDIVDMPPHNEVGPFENLINSESLKSQNNGDREAKSSMGPNKVVETQETSLHEDILEDKVIDKGLALCGYKAEQTSIGEPIFNSMKPSIPESNEIRDTSGELLSSFLCEMRDNGISSNSKGLEYDNLIRNEKLVEQVNGVEDPCLSNAYKTENATKEQEIDCSTMTFETLDVQAKKQEGNTASKGSGDLISEQDSIVSPKASVETDLPPTFVDDTVTLPSNANPGTITKPREEVEDLKTVTPLLYKDDVECRTEPSTITSGGSTLVPGLSESREDKIYKSSMEIAKFSSISSNKPFIPQSEGCQEEIDIVDKTSDNGVATSGNPINSESLKSHNSGDREAKSSLQTNKVVETQETSLHEDILEDRVIDEGLALCGYKAEQTSIGEPSFDSAMKPSILENSELHDTSGELLSSSLYKMRDYGILSNSEGFEYDNPIGNEKLVEQVNGFEDPCLSNAYKTENDSNEQEIDFATMTFETLDVQATKQEGNIASKGSKDLILEQDLIVRQQATTITDLSPPFVDDRITLSSNANLGTITKAREEVDDLKTVTPLLNKDDVESRTEPSTINTFLSYMESQVDGALKVLSGPVSEARECSQESLRGDIYCSANNIKVNNLAEQDSSVIVEHLKEMNCKLQSTRDDMINSEGNGTKYDKSNCPIEKDIFDSYDGVESVLFEETKGLQEAGSMAEENQNGTLGMDSTCSETDNDPKYDDKEPKLEHLVSEDDIGNLTQSKDHQIEMVTSKDETFSDNLVAQSLKSIETSGRETGCIEEGEGASIYGKESPEYTTCNELDEVLGKEFDWQSRIKKEMKNDPQHLQSLEGAKKGSNSDEKESCETKSESAFDEILETGLDLQSDFVITKPEEGRSDCGFHTPGNWNDTNTCVGHLEMVERNENVMENHITGSLVVVSPFMERDPCYSSNLHTATCENASESLQTSPGKECHVALKNASTDIEGLQSGKPMFFDDNVNNKVKQADEMEIVVENSDCLPCDTCEDSVKFPSIYGKKSPKSTTCNELDGVLGKEFDWQTNSTGSIKKELNTDPQQVQPLEGSKEDANNDENEHKLEHLVSEDDIGNLTQSKDHQLEMVTCKNEAFSDNLVAQSLESKETLGPETGHIEEAEGERIYGKESPENTSCNELDEVLGKEFDWQSSIKKGLETDPQQVRSLEGANEGANSDEKESCNTKSECVQSSFPIVEPKEGRNDCGSHTPAKRNDTNTCVGHLEMAERSEIVMENHVTRNMVVASPCMERDICYSASLHTSTCENGPASLQTSPDKECHVALQNVKQADDMDNVVEKSDALPSESSIRDEIIPQAFVSKEDIVELCSTMEVNFENVISSPFAFHNFEKDDSESNCDMDAIEEEKCVKENDISTTSRSENLDCLPCDTCEGSGIAIDIVCEKADNSDANLAFNVNEGNCMLDQQVTNESSPFIIYTTDTIMEQAVYKESRTPGLVAKETLALEMGHIGEDEGANIYGKESLESTTCNELDEVRGKEFDWQINSLGSIKKEVKSDPQQVRPLEGAKEGANGDENERSNSKSGSAYGEDLESGVALQSSLLIAKPEEGRSDCGSHTPRNGNNINSCVGHLQVAKRSGNGMENHIAGSMVVVSPCTKRDSCYFSDLCTATCEKSSKSLQTSPGKKCYLALQKASNDNIKGLQSGKPMLFDDNVNNKVKQDDDMEIVVEKSSMLEDIVELCSTMEVNWQNLMDSPLDDPESNSNNIFSPLMAETLISGNVETEARAKGELDYDCMNAGNRVSQESVSQGKLGDDMDVIEEEKCLEGNDTLASIRSENLDCLPCDTCNDSGNKDDTQELDCATSPNFRDSQHDKENQTLISPTFEHNKIQGFIGTSGVHEMGQETLNDDPSTLLKQEKNDGNSKSNIEDNSDDIIQARMSPNHDKGSEENPDSHSTEKHDQIGGKDFTVFPNRQIGVDVGCEASVSAEVVFSSPYATGSFSDKLHKSNNTPLMPYERMHPTGSMFQSDHKKMKSDVESFLFTDSAIDSISREVANDEVRMSENDALESNVKFSIDESEITNPENNIKTLERVENSVGQVVNGQSPIKMEEKENSCHFDTNNTGKISERSDDLDSVDKVLMSSQIQRKNRSILIHGTPKKPTNFIHEMKENPPTQKRVQMLNATVMKPNLKRKALQDIAK